MATKKKLQYWGTGRRKKAIARVRLIPNGSGAIVINKRNLEDYFGLGTLQLIVKQPLVLTENETKFDIAVNVYGGGLTGQAGAIRHGIARALIQAEPELKPALKKAGFLTRDPRMKERKKYGLKAARRAPQFSKRLSRLQNAQKPWKLNGFRGFSFCPVLAQPDPTKSFLPGTTRGQLPFFRLYGTTSGTTTGTTFRHLGVTISALILPISFI